MKKYKPRKYQKYAEDFLLEHEEAGLFLDMGLGKTVITLTALKKLSWDWNKVLIIAPKYPAMDTWPGELEKWDHLKDLGYSVAAGKTKTEREKAVDLLADITIINQENVTWLVNRWKSRWPYDVVVIDELTSFKSSRSQRWKALRKVRKYISRIIGLTGTPVANGYEDLWAQVYLLDEGNALGKTLTGYRDLYFRPGRRNGYIVYEWLLKPFADKEITDKIRPFCLMMESEDYLELPDLLTIESRFSLSEKSLKKYRALERDHFLDIRGEEIDAVNAAVLVSKLQQLSAGSVYTEDGVVEIHDEKLEAFKSVVSELAGENILVMYQFQHERDRILKEFPEAVYIKEPGAIAEWKKGNIKMLVAHPKSAGHGLNIQTGGSVLIWYGLTASYEQYVQSIKRLHRSGQKNSTVKNIVLMAKGTFDEILFDQILKKKSESHAALAAAIKKRAEEVLGNED